MSDSYAWRGGAEPLLRHGSGCSKTVLVIPALFEEANRMRHLVVDVMRRLADNDIGTILPDLPGQGESMTPLADVAFEDWQAAVATLAQSVGGSIAFRGGGLLDAATGQRWRYASETGDRLVRDLVRATSISSGASMADLDRDARAHSVRLAGNRIGPALYAGLVNAVPTGGAHMSQVEGAHLWRAAEPGSDPALAQALADDIARWAARCVV